MDRDLTETRVWCGILRDGYCKERQMGGISLGKGNAARARGSGRGRLIITNKLDKTKAKYTTRTKRIGKGLG